MKTGSNMNSRNNTMEENDNHITYTHKDIIDFSCRSDRQYCY